MGIVSTAMNNQYSMFITKKVRILFAGVLLLSLFSCANFKEITAIKALKPEDLEPRITFIDKQVVEVERTQIKSVDAEKVIRSYERLLDRGDPEIRKEALHRLADLTMRLAESKLSTSDATNLSKLTPAVKKSSFSKAIQYYRVLLDENPGYDESDEVKYQLARAHSLNSDPESSLNILDQIAVEHVESISYIESQFRRGESYFVRKKYLVAEQAYAEVVNKGRNSEFYDKALYKKGWSLFKQELFLESLGDFFELYEKLFHQQKLQTNSKLLNDLLLDTRRVISLTFYNMEGAESVKEYFATHGGQPFEDQIYASLAELYIEQERFSDAADTYLGFIQYNPLSLVSPDFHSRVIEVYRKGGFPSLILPAKESFVVNYGRQSLFWQRYDGKVIEDLKPLLRTHLEDISAFYHANAQKSKKPGDYLIAAKWYQEILATFNDPQVDSKYRFLLAETLYDGGQLVNSAKEYEIVAYENNSSQFSRDAGYRALVAYQEMKHPESSSPLEKLMPSIQSGLRFSKAFASDPEAPAILARVSEQQLQINDIQAAIDSGNQLLALPSKPTSGQKDRARIIIANGLFDLKRYAEAEVAISQLLASAKLDKKQRLSFRQRRVESIYKLAEAAKAENRVEEAVELFLKVKHVEPDSKIAISAHFDAAALLLQVEQWKRATDLLESFRKSYPKHSLSETIPEKLALAYEKQNDWNNAAEEYTILAKRQSNPDLAREGYWRVADLYLKADSKIKAIATFKKYVWTYPEPYLLAQEGRYNLVQLYIKTGDLTKSHFWRQKIVSFYAKNKSDNNARTGFLAAESKYILSKPLFEKFKKIKLKLPLASSLKKKRAAMKKALNAYNKIAQYNVAEFTTASTHKVARIYQILSQDLMSSQRPKGLNEEEAEEYGFLIEEQALPFEDKAINFFEVNALRTINLIYDESVKASIEALKELKPVQYNKTERLEELENVQF